MKLRKEKLVFGAIALIFLIPIAIVQNKIDEDHIKVVFLRWIDNQEAYEGQSLQKIIGTAD